MANDESVTDARDQQEAATSAEIAKIRKRIATGYYPRLAARIARWATPRPGMIGKLIGLPNRQKELRLAKLAGVMGARAAMARDELAVYSSVSSERAGFAATNRRVIQLQEALLQMHVERPKKSGALNRAGRWCWRDRAKTQAIELYRAKSWQSKKQCAKSITSQIVTITGNRLGINAEDTVYEWLCSPDVGQTSNVRTPSRL